MKLKVFGLNKCSTCQKAVAWLDENDLQHGFSDVKEVPLDPAQVSKWSGALGGWEKMINKASTTWRTLPPGRQAPGSDAEWKLLLKEHPALIKRPVMVTADGVVMQGFSDNGYKLRFGIGK